MVLCRGKRNGLVYIGWRYYLYEMELTSVNIGDVKIMEPVTALTDLIVSLVCVIAFIRLKKSKHHRSVTIRLYRSFFLTMALATAFGGIVGHAFLHYLSFEWKLPGWVISMLSVALAERGSIIHARPLLKKHMGNFFSWINIIELLAFISLAMFTLKFIFVEIHAVYGLLLVLFSFELFVYRKTGDKGSKLALWSVFFGFLAMLIHLTKFSIHQWFNYLDLSHVMMAISSYVLYKGVERMEMHAKDH